jgi:L-seryl-tRNA(Ser) seleniumtransferase
LLEQDCPVIDACFILKGGALPPTLWWWRSAPFPIAAGRECSNMASDSSRQSLLRKIPAVEILLRELESAGRGVGIPRKLIADCIRAAVDQTRAAILTGPGEVRDEATIRREILSAASRRLEANGLPHYRKSINATGIILHTALGRAVLPARALRQIQEELSGYSLVQTNAESGRRAKRDARVEWLLQQLTGAEAATVVNNNAAATAIVLNTVARDREVIVSRGQLVEIGGSFRLPEVMETSGVKLVEVGATNKTHARDYERAITERTAAILRVHPSNYKISGFTAEVPLSELERIAHAHGLVLIDDVGAGPLVDFSRFGFEPEPTLPQSVATGADIITCSADKLIGGPQGGIVLGRAEWIQRVRKNPLARIVRVDKLTLAALEATLTLFLDETLAMSEVPTLRMLRRSLDEIAAQAERIAQALRERAAGAVFSVIDGCSQMGSGSLPTQELPTKLVAVDPQGLTPDELAVRLRRQRPAVFARIHKGQLLLDPRTLLDGEEQPLVEACIVALSTEAS